MRTGRVVWVGLLVLAVAACLAWNRQWREREVLREAERGVTETLKRAPPHAPVFGRALPARPKMHDRMGRLEIRRLHISVPVVEGADADGLKMGAAHIVGTGYPGDAANVGIAAHRDTYFRALRDIRSGDEIVLSTEAGVFRYEVGGTEIVAPSDVRVLQSAGRAEVTLVTCYPFFYKGHAPKRFIVHARLVGGQRTGLRG